MSAPDYSKIVWSNIPIGPEHCIGRILYSAIDRGPWWRRIWRGKWRRYEYKAKWLPPP